MKEVVINKDESENGILSELKRVVTKAVTLLDPPPLFRTKSAIGAIANATIPVRNACTSIARKSARTCQGNLPRRNLMGCDIDGDLGFILARSIQEYLLQDLGI